MAGKEFTISQVVDPKVISELKALREEFDQNNTAVTGLTRSMLDLTKVNPSNFGDLKKKYADVNSAVSQLAKTQQTQINLQERQAKSLENIAKSLQIFGRLDSLSKAMENFTKHVNDATNSLNGIKESTETVSSAQNQGAKSTTAYANSFKDASASLGLASGEYAKIIKNVIAFDSQAEDLNIRLANNKIQLEQVRKEQSLLQKSFQSGALSYNEYVSALATNNQRSQELMQAQRQMNNVLNAHANVIVSTAGSYNEMNAAILQLERRYKTLDQFSRQGIVGQNMLKDIDKLRTELKTIDASMGNYQRNVGNYSSAYNGLSFGIQQVARELPVLKMGFDVFFLAIGNNIPILADEIVRARDNYKSMVATGASATPVWKQVLSSIFSWQSGMVVAITLLSVFGKEIVNWISGLFDAKNALDDVTSVQKQLNEARASGVKDTVKERTELKLLYEASQNQNRSMEDRISAVNELQKKYPEYFKNISDENILAGKASLAYQDLTKNIISAARARATQDTIIKNEEKRLELDNQRIGNLVKVVQLQKQIDAAELKRGQSQGYTTVTGSIVTGGQVDDSMIGDLQRKMQAAQAQADNLRNAIEYIDKKNTQLASSIAIEDLLNPDKLDQGYKKVVEVVESNEAYMRRIENAIARARASLIEQERQNEIESLKAEYFAKASIIKGNSEKELELRALYQENIRKGINDINERFDRQIEQQNLDNKLSYIEEGSKEEMQLRLSLNEVLREEEIANAEKTGADILDINRKYDNLYRGIILDNLSFQSSIDEKNLAHKLLVSNSAMQAELADLEMRNMRGEELQEDYEKQKAEITQRYALAASKEQLYLLEDQLKREGDLLDPEKRIELENAIAEARINLDNLVLENLLENEKISEQERKKHIDGYIEATRKISDAAEGMTGGLDPLFNQINDFIELGINGFDKLWDKMSDTDKVIFALGAIAQVAMALTETFSNMYDSRIEELEKESEALQESHDSEIERIERLNEIGAISTEEAEARKRAAEDQTRIKQEEIERKKVALQIKQAKLDKANAILQIALNTGIGIMRAVSAFPLTGGMPWAAIVAALGAVQLAAVAAQPLPKYAKGTDSHKGGLAVVGDGGKNELAIFPSGQMWITPNTPTVVDMPKNTKVIPDISMIKDYKKNVRTDAMMALMFSKMREKDGTIVNVNMDIISLEKSINKGFNDNNKLLKQSISSQYKTAYYMSYLNKLNNIKTI